MTKQYLSNYTYANYIVSQEKMDKKSMMRILEKLGSEGQIKNITAHLVQGNKSKVKVMSSRSYGLYLPLPRPLLTHKYQQGQCTKTPL